MFASCSNGYEKKISDNSLVVKFKIEDISSTKIKFGVRAVGLDKVRGFHILMMVEDRDTIVMYHRYGMSAKPKKEILKKIVSDIKIQVSPDKKHFALSFIDTGTVDYMFHLLPKGVPFSTEQYNKMVAESGFENIDWNTVPAPRKIAADFIQSRIKESDNYSIRNDELWEAVAANIPDDNFNRLVVECWPYAVDSKPVVDSLLLKASDYNNPFFDLLKSKIYKMLENDTSKFSGLTYAVVAGYRFPDERLHALVYKRMIEVWPESPVLFELVPQVFNEFPDSVQSKLIEKSIEYSKQSAYTATKLSNRDFLREFAGNNQEGNNQKSKN